MHKRENLAKLMGRESAMTGWRNRKQLLRQQKRNMLSEFNQRRMSLGRGHHLARSFKGHDRQWKS